MSFSSSPLARLAQASGTAFVPLEFERPTVSIDQNDPADVFLGGSGRPSPLSGNTSLKDKLASALEGFSSPSGFSHMRKALEAQIETHKVSANSQGSANSQMFDIALDPATGGVKVTPFDNQFPLSEFPARVRIVPHGTRRYVVRLAGDVFSRAMEDALLAKKKDFSPGEFSLLASSRGKKLSTLVYSERDNILNILRSDILELIRQGKMGGPTREWAVDYKGHYVLSLGVNGLIKPQEGALSEGLFVDSVLRYGMKVYSFSDYRDLSLKNPFGQRTTDVCAVIRVNMPERSKVPTLKSARLQSDTSDSQAFVSALIKAGWLAGVAPG